MSYYNFRNIAGMDHLIDRNEYAAYKQATNPYTDPYTNYRHANHEFSLMDRNGDGRVDYYEYADAQRRKYGHYPQHYNRYRSYGNYY